MLVFMLLALALLILLLISFLAWLALSSLRSVWPLAPDPLKRLFFGISAGKLVAMTVTFSSPFFNFSSRIVPKITLASLSMDSVIILAASWI